MSHRDPREGEHPEDIEWCFEHHLRKESCGPCHQDEIDLTTAQAGEALAKFFRDKLDQIRDREIA